MDRPAARTTEGYVPRSFILPQRGSSVAGKAYWALLQRVALTAASIDAGYILLFLWLGSVPLAAVNAVSIAMYLGAWWLIGKRHNTAGVLLIWLEVVGHSALGSLLIGWDSGFHYYLLLFIPSIVIANTRGFAAPLVLLLLAYYLGLRALCDQLGPLAPLPAQSVQVVNWLHIVLVFGMFAALAAFYRRTILNAEARLRKQATLDPLTGLNNRGHFQTLAAHTLARSQRDGTPVALLLCDVDHFKRINDQHGHGVGDEVLAGVSRLLHQSLRESDVIARWGGEEFLTLMPACTTDAACATAERIRAAVEKTPFGAEGIAVTMSFGVAQVSSADDLQAAIARADAALYRAKNQGRNRVILADDEEAKSALQIEALAKPAIEPIRVKYKIQLRSAKPAAESVRVRYKIQLRPAEPAVEPVMAPLVDSHRLSSLAFQRSVLDWRDNAHAETMSTMATLHQTFTRYIDGQLDDIGLLGNFFANAAYDTLLQEFIQQVRIPMSDCLHRQEAALAALAKKEAIDQKGSIHFRTDALASGCACLMGLDFKPSERQEIIQRLHSSMLGDGGIAADLCSQATSMVERLVEEKQAC